MTTAKTAVKATAKSAKKAPRRPRAASGATVGGKRAGEAEEARLARSTGGSGGAGVPAYFLPVRPSAADFALLRRAEVPELLKEAERVAGEAAAFLVVLELVERVRRRLEGVTAGGWVYVDLDDFDDDVEGWLESVAERLPGTEPGEVVRGLRDVLASFGEGADKSALLRQVAVLQRAAVAGLAGWRNMLGIIHGVLVAKGSGKLDADAIGDVVADKLKNELGRIVADVRSIMRKVSGLFGKTNRSYTPEDYAAMQGLLKTLSEQGAAHEILKERFRVEDPSSREEKALVKAFQRWKKEQTARSDKL